MQPRREEIDEGDPQSRNSLSTTCEKRDQKSLPPDPEDWVGLPENSCDRKKQASNRMEFNSAPSCNCRVPKQRGKETAPSACRT